ncbi:hypothetical protein L596_003937 [Steinernema carpocapsae]|uniref:Homeobox domain-containing protein n=1 Tax=Steinernema carpocapsae TaxID=34508 RepID=A0A4U8UXI4_STECR|nr:hypothetical protein L596_003937 [Steinernema carpocapsae]
MSSEETNWQLLSNKFSILHLANTCDQLEVRPRPTSCPIHWLISLPVRSTMRPYFAGNTNENAYASSAINFRQSSDYENCSKRRFRTNFTENQSLVLEEAFQESHYPDQSAKQNYSLVPKQAGEVEAKRSARARKEDNRLRATKQVDASVAGRCSTTSLRTFLAADHSSFASGSSFGPRCPNGLFAF